MLYVAYASFVAYLLGLSLFNVWRNDSKVLRGETGVLFTNV